ncbi:SDR family oxidoreductase [Nonomuraea sp. NPDC050691]|uniref:SDR family oxidoreductase n=1 Tax=Nonomuraea sp. NPDC050691 TaxID=3155661 RepID=UPI0034052926
MVRAHLQRDQGRVDDVLQGAGHRGRRRRHPRQLRQPRPGPHPGLGEDGEGAQRRRLAASPRRRRPRARPIGRFATPEEVADLLVFLCSDRATYSVGSTYFIDGGMLRTV